jgi:hypothetical protein
MTTALTPSRCLKYIVSHYILHGMKLVAYAMRVICSIMLLLIRDESGTNYYEKFNILK